MLEGGPMRFKPVPPNWGNRRLDRRNRLTAALQRTRICTRLAQIAYQVQQSSEPHEPSPLLRAYKPRADAIEAIPNLKSLWRAKSTEGIQIALDSAQSALLQALESGDPRMRMIAVEPRRLMHILGWRALILPPKAEARSPTFRRPVAAERTLTQVIEEHPISMS